MLLLKIPEINASFLLLADSFLDLLCLLLRISVCLLKMIAIHHLMLLFPMLSSSLHQITGQNLLQCLLCLQTTQNYPTFVSIFTTDIHLRTLHCLLSWIFLHNNTLSQTLPFEFSLCSLSHLCRPNQLFPLSFAQCIHPLLSLKLLLLLFF